MTDASVLKLVPRARAQAHLGPAVRRDRTGLSLYALRPYAPGDVVLEFRNLTWRIDRDQFTVEHPSGAHVFHPLLAKAAHSCEPNTRLDLRQRVMLATRAIRPDDCISFDYASTERRISHPFDCLCRSRACRGRIG
jgi:hypothetical protein